jgi:hypothetical protein
MSQNVTTALREAIPGSSITDEALTGDNVSDFNKSLSMMIQDDGLKQKVEKGLAMVDSKLGLRALEDKDAWSPDNKVECILHYMRWEPSYLFDCSIRELHEYEMIMASMLAFIQDKHNKWIIQTKLANKKLNRVKKLAASHYSGKSVGEREAAAMQDNRELRVIESRIDIFGLYSQKCEGLVDAFESMDNSLKKTLDRRRFEELVQNKLKERDLQA